MRDDDMAAFNPYSCLYLPELMTAFFFFFFRAGQPVSN